MSDHRGSVRASDDDVLSSCDAEDRRVMLQWSARLGLDPADIAVFTRHGFYYEKIPAQDTPHRRSLLQYLKKSETPPPKWVMISGLLPGCLFNEQDRRKRLRALYKALVLLIKRALLRAALDPFKAERSVYWDPIAEVCRDLEIAQSKLSALCKEFAGHSLSQVVDCVRAENLRGLMKAQVKSFVQEWLAHRATLETEKQAEATAAGVWRALKESRRWPAFCQNTWAMGLGFASYRKLYRACVAEWRKTPHQMELEVIAEVLGSCLIGDEVPGMEIDEAAVLRVVEERLRAVHEYSDGYENDRLERIEPLES